MTPTLPPGWPAATLQRALEHHQRGQLHEAEALYVQILAVQPRHADALHLRGVVALQRGQHAAACDLIRQAIAVRPADNFYCNLGNALKASGRRDEAIACYRQSLALNAAQPQALGNLADALLGDAQAGAQVVEEAADCCRRAIALRPEAAEAHCNLGNALLRAGRTEQALASYRQALRLQPELAVVHDNLGLALWAAGRIEEAVAAWRRALELGADSAELLSRLGLAMQQLGQLDEAIACHVQALRRSDADPIRRNFVQAIRTAHFGAPDAETRALILRALDEGWADAGELLTPAASLIECEPATREALVQQRGAAVLAPGLLARLAGDRLLLTLLVHDVINSVALERLLTRLRRQLLDQALGGRSAGPQGAATLLHCALAHQCFFNEYVYACGDDEQQQLAALGAQLGACHASGTLPPAAWLVAWASYAPLSALDAAQAWAALDWPAPLAALFTQQVREPATEVALRALMPRLTAIADPVSQQVREQYEEHPYPRWSRAPQVAGPETLDALLQAQFPGVAVQPPGQAGALEVLVAGCGTGQHPIRLAQQFPGARILAVDLSLASLGYARRKTEEAGIRGIEYAQADILALAGLARRFDLIESVGVLHHLADPLAGWRVLLESLRPGGLMVLGLYSELGRRDVVAARQRLAGTALPRSADEIRRCRQTLMEGAVADAVAPPFDQFLSSRDFYATSACRDLLFHVQEHRFTLPQLKAILASLGLHFIGFVLDAEPMSAYARRFPDDPARTNLDHWHAFETVRPETFSRMYQFWVQKPR